MYTRLNDMCNFFVVVFFFFREFKIRTGGYILRKFDTNKHRVNYRVHGDDKVWNIRSMVFIVIYNCLIINYDELQIWCSYEWV